MSNTPTSPIPYAPTSVYKRYGDIEDLTPEFLSANYLVGLTFVDENDVAYPASWYQQKVAVAISHFEHHTNLTVLPDVVENEMHDYHLRDYEQFAYVQLFHRPVLNLDATPIVRAVYPTGQLITTFPREWVRLDPHAGTIQLVPTQGTLSQVILGQGGSYLPIIYQGLSYLPQLLRVDYTAGFAKGKLPQIFLDAIAKLASIEILSSVGDSVRPSGITNESLSVDGLSESRGYQQSPEYAPVFSGRISQYQRELFGDPKLGTLGLFAEIKGYYHGLNMMVTI